MAFSSSTVISGQVTKKSDYDRLMNNTVHILRSATTFTGAKTFTSTISANDGITVPVMHVQEQMAVGTSPGGLTANTWTKRTLNTELTNTITGSSLSSGQITLPTGTYKINAAAPGYNINRHSIRIYNTSDSVIELSGVGDYMANTGGIINIVGIITVVGNKIFELQHACQTTNSTNGMGLSMNAYFSVPYETYTDVFIEKLA